MVLYEMLTGLPPWYSEDKKAVARGILHGQLQLPSSMGAGAQAAVAALLVRDPEKRLCSREGVGELKRHVFFKGTDWAGIEVSP